jgi:transcription initiation factor TFIID subunit 2
MDFGTMRTKLSQGKYQTMEDFKNDAQLIFNNCRQFNPPTTYPANCADIVEKKFREEWAKAMEKKLSWNEKRGLQSIMTNFVKEDMYATPAQLNFLIGS